jgi:hypothetical protein
MLIRAFAGGASRLPIAPAGEGSLQPQGDSTGRTQEAAMVITEPHLFLPRKAKTTA